MIQNITFTYTKIPNISSNIGLQFCFFFHLFTIFVTVHHPSKQSFLGLTQINQSERTIHKIAVIRDLLLNKSSLRYNNDLMGTAMNRGGQEEDNKTLPTAITRKTNEQHQNQHRP